MQILHAPAGHTLRLGIYGGWGEGKTSVLELMRLRLTAAKQVCVWITPWTATSRDDVMGQIVDQLREQLPISDEALKRTKQIARALGATTIAAEEGSWWSKAAAHLFAPAVKARYTDSVTRATQRFFEVVREQLGDRRVVVFIDDIDRVKPELVPDILLTLREALDQPNFFYVMALAPEIVERGLTMIHHGWGTAGDFLEKIVEYPRFLPVATDAEIELFIRRSIDALGGAIDVQAIRQLLPLLPRNPRKLKMYLRFIASLHGLLRRFHPSEIDLYMLYGVQLLRSEFPEPARTIARDEAALKDLERGHILELMRRKTEAATEEAKPNRPSEKYLAETTAPERKERFDQLYNAVRSRDALLSGSYKLQSLFTLPDEPPLFTWKEHNHFAQTFATAAEDSRDNLVVSQVTRDGAIDAARIRAFFELTLQIREAALGQASEAFLETERAETTREAAALTDILDVLIRKLRAFETGLLSAAQWKALLAHVQRWAHFNHPNDYAILRNRERMLLTSSVEAMYEEGREAALDILGPLRDYQLSGQEPDEFRGFLASLGRSLHQWAIRTILRHFETADGLARYWTDRGSIGMKNLLFTSSSPLFRDAESRASFEALALRARETPTVQLNFVQFARMLLYAATEGGNFPRDDARHIIQDSDLIKVIWSAALATPLNPRMAGGLRDRRLRLISENVVDQLYADANLAIPEWWQVLEGTFFT